MIQLKEIRSANNWTQADLASRLGIGRPTLLAIEKGERSLDLDELSRLAALLGVEPADLLMGRTDNYEKYKQLLLTSLSYGADRDGKVTKTKLAKLIYLADFAWYYEHLEPLTGVAYRREKQGPVPDMYFRAVDELIEQGKVNLECKETAGGDLTMLLSLSLSGEATPRNKLSREQVDLVKKIGKKWNKARTKEIVDFTHEQLPWKICREGEIIPYELITQQDPAHVY